MRRNNSREPTTACRGWGWGALLNTKQTNNCQFNYTRLPKPSVHPNFLAARTRVAAFHSQPFRRAQRSGSAQVLEENEELRRLLANGTVDV